MDMATRYPSPSSTATQSGSASPLKLSDSQEIQVCTDDTPPPPKKRRLAAPKPRTTEYLDLENRDDAAEAQLERLLTTLRRKKKIVVIAGAGISVSAGSKSALGAPISEDNPPTAFELTTACSVPDFRSREGLFKTLGEKHKIKGGGKSLFDASVYKDDKSTAEFHKMVRDLSSLTKEAKSTPFHHMLATIAQEGRLMRLYSQNVDCLDTSLKPLATNIPLNTKAPWPVTIQLHGGLEKMQCTKCSQVDSFNGDLFQGSEPPLCGQCQEADYVRTAFGGKRSHGIGRLRPRMVLYNEYNPDEDAIGKVSQADLRRVPDAVIVVGTSLKVPGVRRIVRELCLATRSKRDGITAWINLDPVPQAPDMKGLWDLVVRGKCDDIAGLLNLPHWDCDTEDIGKKEEYMVSGSAEKEVEYKERCSRDRIAVLLANKKRSFDQSSDAESQPSDMPDLRAILGDKIQDALPTPSASPRHGTPQLRKPLPQGKVKQSTLSFGGQTATAESQGKASKATKPRKPRQPKRTIEAAKPSAGINKAFKATKTVPKIDALDKTLPKQVKNESPSPKLSSPLGKKGNLPNSLPSLRPDAQSHGKIPYLNARASSSELSFISAKSDVEENRALVWNSKPRGM
jgi:NAD+-dependent protein deacetylase SIR2